ncbi:hypothetical protein BU17DRAFT_66445 [Hysterangium stoloniferum]|nr:hypothetical protein BU17DRAFT_66445 [Hysterangium stoloniferum]
MTAAAMNNNAWLQSTLCDLLGAPHISIRGIPGIRMGPGPVDIFSTRFNNHFALEVKAIVAGESVDRGGLKEKLLGLQQHYVPGSAKFQTESEDSTKGTSDGEAHVFLTGEAENVGAYEVSVSAETSAGDILDIKEI